MAQRVTLHSTKKKREFWVKYQKKKSYVALSCEVNTRKRKDKVRVWSFQPKKKLFVCGHLFDNIACGHFWWVKKMTAYFNYRLRDFFNQKKKKDSEISLVAGAS